MNRIEFVTSILFRYQKIALKSKLGGKVLLVDLRIDSNWEILHTIVKFAFVIEQSLSSDLF